jgi:chemotaxis protein MotB
MDKARPIIIIKKKGSHGGHHGGAWKVAYADFVTAMMALFIVLWLLSAAKPDVKVAVAGYFNDPSGTGAKAGTSMTGSGPSLTITKDDVTQLKEKLEKAVKQMANFDKIKDQIKMTVTPEGLRIDLLETATGTFFDSGNPRPNKNGEELLMTLAEELGKVPNKISIEGHTDSQPYAVKGDYGNWELSADRANAARRIMQEQGLGQNQVSQVRGYADQQLRKPDAPFDPSNRRISVIVHYIAKTPEEQAADAANAEGKNGETKATTEGKSEASQPKETKPGEEAKPKPDAGKKE